MADGGDGTVLLRGLLFRPLRGMIGRAFCSFARFCHGRDPGPFFRDLLRREDRFLHLWEDPRMCPHFHLPLQSGSDSVLKRMARRTTLGEFRRLVETALSVNPAFAITTDVIAGFHSLDRSPSRAGISSPILPVRGRVRHG